MTEIRTTEDGQVRLYEDSQFIAVRVQAGKWSGRGAVWLPKCFAEVCEAEYQKWKEKKQNDKDN